MVDRERLQRDLHFFATETPSRGAGSQDEAKAFDYIQSKLRSAGWQVAFEEFETLQSAVHKTTLRVEDGPSLAAMGIGYSTGRGADRPLELVDAGDGSLAAYDGIDAFGKAVLVSAGGLSVPDKAFVAYHRGAAALLLSSPPTPKPTLALRAQKGIWGPPQPEDLMELPDLTSLSISHEDGERLRGLLDERGTLRVILQRAAQTGWQTLRQLVARLGPQEGEFVLLHGHVDAWSPGVTDNATGCAALLEVARALGKDPPPRGIAMAFWTGHEVEEASGSAAFVDRHWQDLRRCIAHLNVDSPGCEGGDEVVLYRSLELRRLARASLAALGVPVAEELPLAKESDNSFALAGVPGLGVVPASEPFCRDDGRDVAPLWWMHTARDSLERVDLHRLARDTVLVEHLARALAESEVASDFSPVAEVLEESIAAGDEDLLALWPEARERLLGVTTSDGARCLSRLLLATVGTRGGRLRHDRYGDPLYAFEYPGIAHLLGAPADPHTLAAARLRERNRLDDLFHLLARVQLGGIA